MNLYSQIVFFESLVLLWSHVFKSPSQLCMVKSYQIKVKAQSLEIGSIESYQ